MPPLWTLKDADKLLRDILEMSEEEIRTEIIAVGDDPDEVIALFDSAVEAAISRARRAQAQEFRNRKTPPKRGPAE